MDGNADSTSKPLFGQYSAAKDSGDRPRVRLPGVQEAQARLQDQGTPKLSKALLKPFRFNQKSEENVPPRPFRFSLQPSTPIRSLEVQSARRATSRSTLSTTTNVQTHGSPFEPSERFENTLPASTHLDFGGFRQSGLLNTPNSVASSSNRDDNNGGEDSFVEKVARDFANLKQRNATLQTQNERLTDAHEQSLQEIQRLKSQLSSLSVQLSASEQKNEQLQGALRETEVQLANSTANLKAANETTNGLTEKIQSLTLDFQSLRQENAKISVKEAKTNQRLDEARLVVSGLRESFKQQSEDMQELKDAQGRIQERYGRAIREIQDLRSQASECTSAFQGQSSANVWMASAKEGRTIINELKGELETSRRVSDILRDKLHHMASQLLESKERVKELEQERYDSMARLDTNLRETNDRIESALKLDQAQQEILKRLADRERETIDALTEAAKVEEMLVLAKKEIARLSGVCKAKEAELIPLRSAREDHLSKMLAMQDIVNARDREITGLRTELKSLFESKEDLRALLAEAKKSIVEKEQELSQARSLNPEIESRMQELKERFSSFETAILERSALESKVAALQRECGERDIRIKGLQALLDQERKSSEQAKSASDRLTEASAKERSTLAERHRTELQDLRRELLKEMNALIDSHREELKKKEDALQQALNKHREDLKDAENRFKGELERHRQRIAEKEGQVTSLQTRIVEITQSHHVEKEAALKEVESRYRKELLDHEASSKQQDTRYQRELQAKDAAVENLKSSLSQERLEHTKTKGHLKSVSEHVQALEDTVAELRQRTAKEREIQVQLQRAQDLRATESQTACALAQREAEEHRAAAMTWQEKVNLLSTKLEETQEQLRASEEQVKKLLPCADVEALQRELNLLRAANADLVSRSDDVMGRYKRGELTDGERELVQYVVELTETSNEQRIIEKENEIRDRVNQLAACQARIKLLQRRVAEMLEKNGAEARPLLNIRSLAVSSPIDNAQQVEGPSKHDRPQSPATPPRIQVEEPSFIKLAQETASDDYNGHSPLTDLSQISQFSDKAKKRPRPKSLVSSEAAVVRKRPAKDTSKQPSMGNVNAGPKSGSSKKDIENAGLSKTRQRKRK